MASSSIKSVSNVVGVSLILISVIATSGTALTVFRSGFGKLLKTALSAHPPRLPVVDVPVKHTYTGLPPVDGFIRAFHVLIYPAIDGTWPGLCMSAWEFSGMFSVTWIVASLEGLRAGNRGKLISTVIAGTLAQSLTYSTIMPVYLGLHVLTSPTALSSPSPLAQDFFIDPPALAAWAPAYALAYMLPTFLVALPAPKYFSWTTRQNIMAWWELYPIPFKIFQILLARYMFDKTTGAFIFPTSSSAPPSSSSSAVSKSSSSSTTTTASRKKTTLHLLQNFYLFAIAFSTVTHLITLTLTISPLLFPSLFSSTVVSALHSTPSATSLRPTSVLIPSSPFSSVKVTTAGEGLWRLLVWNASISSIAPLIWGLLMVRNAFVVKAAGERSTGGAGGEGDGAWIWFVVKVIGISAVAGPGSGVAWCLWERDTVVLGGSETEGKSK
ncbi:MAG: hypothetical protein LQ350_008062 [Teloschistes chrysophthalmus]|nr:MAG: hypothetical protein LQ350_008062 [Niorma chrysophthalma]